MLRARILDGFELANPVLCASGTYGAGLEAAQLAEVSRLGAIVTKTVTLRPRRGNPPPRLAETPSGMLNSIGLENPGVEAFVDEVLPRALELGPPIVVNVGGETVDEYAEVAGRVEASGAAALELNLSCPNVQGGELPFATEPEACAEVVRAVRRASRLPFFVKLTPNVRSVTPIARAAEEAGADGLTLCNTVLGMAVDWRKRRPKLSTGQGGLSGPAIRPIALRAVALAAREVGIPILASGGIASGEDACEFLCAGAAAVQVGTASFTDPRAPLCVLDELGRLLETQGLSVEDLRGSLELPES